MLKAMTCAQPSVQIGSVSTVGKKHANVGLDGQDALFIRTFSYPKRGRLGFLSCCGSESVQCAGVFDGHGDKGKEISKLAAERTEFAIVNLLNSGLRNLKQVARKAFKQVAKDLQLSELSIDSGTTGSLILIRGRTVVMTHVGDSTITVWDRKGKKGPSVKARYISTNHRPEVDSEKDRIIKCGGIVIEDYVLSKDKTGGLGVTRTLGDRDMQGCGCISEPEVVQMKFHHGQSIVVATDGLWDDNQVHLKKVMSSVQKYFNDPSMMAKDLLSLTTDHGQPFDDTTILCLTRQ